MPTRIEKLASNSTLYYRGDVCMEVSPFTNYYLFTIYRESTDEEIDNQIPLDLTNLGTIYLTFISGDSKIRIPHSVGVEKVDMVNGEVLFRIAEEDANKILSLSNHTFYISSVVEGKNSASDETVFYTGQWIDYATGMQTSLTDTISQLNQEIKNLQVQFANQTDGYEFQIAELNNRIRDLMAENDALKAQMIQTPGSYIEANIVNEDPNIIPTPISPKTTTNLSAELTATNLERSTLKSQFTVFTPNTNAADTNAETLTL